MRTEKTLVLLSVLWLHNSSSFVLPTQMILTDMTGGYVAAHYLQVLQLHKEWKAFFAT